MKQGRRQRTRRSRRGSTAPAFGRQAPRIGIVVAAVLVVAGCGGESDNESAFCDGMVRLAERMQGVDPSDPSTLEEYVVLLSDVEYPEDLQADATTAINEFEFLLIAAERAGGGAGGFGEAMQRTEVSASVDRAFRALVPIERRAQACEEYAPYVQPL